ncbi:MAG: bifunctional glycosyltransferase/CDP-glycerol:glycerophosphate glycerophosphotransferase [Nocardioides sp.]|uniref:bifunctional glycosyltransferase/CDP-glycerol:glycerophosphate glycerophosphotransferase n=1 Tax=Nocardioides sp. TaxID=35761 RepID=UPI003D6AB184
MSSTPLFSLVVPTYGVEAWIGTFLESLRRQVGGLGDAELIFVVDGSPDRSEELIRRWITDHDVATARVIVKENGGLSSARNAGLDSATGTWVSFPDPDDALDENYLQGVRDYLATGEEPDYVACRFMPFSGEDPSTAQDDHPLSFRFKPGTRTVDLDLEPRYFPFSVNNSFGRLEFIREEGLRFDARVRPVAEDGVYTAHYLAARPSRRVGFIAESMYFYRKRGDGSSLVDKAWADHDRYTAVLRHGFITAMDRFGDNTPPTWLQFMSLYDLQWYFKNDARSGSVTASVPEEVLVEFHQLVDRLIGRIDPRSFLDYDLTWMPEDLRMAWYSARTGSVPSGQRVRVDHVDPQQRATRFTYYLTDPEETETLLVRGIPTPAMGAKSRALNYFGRTFVYERIGWVDAQQDWAMVLPGQTTPAQIVFSSHDVPSRYAHSDLVWSRLRGRGTPRPELPAPAPWEEPKHRSLWRRARGRLQRELTKRHGVREPQRVKKLARSKKVRKKYHRAWVLMDRDTMARDNAETLYRHLREAHPEVNAWFVLSKSSPDWSRLKADGFRLVAYGTQEHVLLMKNAAHLISSQIDRYIVTPYDFARYGREWWRFTFLQHGVTKDDLSHWFNSKTMHLMLATGEAEYASFVSDKTPYKLTSREVEVTGFPRHDDLQRLLDATPNDDRNVVLIIPTWRQYLLTSDTTSSNQRALAEGFHETAYFQNWIQVLSSPQIRDAATRAGVEVAFAPHPNLQGLLGPGDVPDWVHLVSYADDDIKSWIARATLAVTDYSSLAFDAAYVHTPSVYFQFDREEFFAGAHAYRKGYFSYPEDGFGPVVEDAEAAISEVIAAIESPKKFVEPFADRIEHVFAHRDTHNSERTVQAIRRINKPLRNRLSVVDRPEVVEGAEEETSTAGPGPLSVAVEALEQSARVPEQAVEALLLAVDALDSSVAVTGPDGQILDPPMEHDQSTTR